MIPLADQYVRDLEAKNKALEAQVDDLVEQLTQAAEKHLRQLARIRVLEDAVGGPILK